MGAWWGGQNPSSQLAVVGGKRKARSFFLLFGGGGWLLASPFSRLCMIGNLEDGEGGDLVLEFKVWNGIQNSLVGV